MKLEVGYSSHFEVRTEHYSGFDKQRFDILYLSDLHFNRHSRNIARSLANRINEINPTILLLGGDYVDSKKGLVYLEQLLTVIGARKNVFAIAGNHDYFFGLGGIEACMRRNGIDWIENETRCITIENTPIRIDGNCPSPEKGAFDFAILCLHRPIEIAPYTEIYNAVFAGHLHGSQFVFWENGKGLYPGRFFYHWNRLKACIGNCIYLISKGLGDTLPIRYNCKKEIIWLQVGDSDQPCP